jgi:hypothetical protein
MLLALEQPSHDAFTRAASISLFVCIIAINAIWIVIKLELGSHRSRRWFSIDDIRDLKLLAARQSDSSKRIAYIALTYAWRICVILLFVLPLTLLGIGYLLSRAH